MQDMDKAVELPVENKSIFNRMNIKKIKVLPWRGLFALLGGFLIQLTLGSFYSFGNMMTYMTSYMRMNGSPNITYGDIILVQSVWGMTQGISMPLSGFIIRRIGNRLAILMGCIIFSSGAALTYFTIDHSVWSVAFTYGFISAFGQGIALIPTMTIAMKWFPKRKGMAMGIVVGGFGGGAFIFNQIQTAILNPKNVKVDSSSGYFTDEELLNRVPYLMLILGCIYFCISLSACIMVTEPSSVDTRVKNKKEQDEQREKEDENEDEDTKEKEKEDYTSIKVALRQKEFYLLWITRFSIVLITQMMAGFYKAFGLTFIEDDHFLSLVGAICSLFNCTGRLFFGLLMDKTSYKTAMAIEASLITVLVAVLITASYGGKIAFALLIWSIFFVFPGTFAIMPAATIQTYGHKHGGTIYGFFFSADIPNNLIIWIFSKMILDSLGWLGLFLIVSAFGLVALCATLLFPKHPKPYNNTSNKSNLTYC